MKFILVFVTSLLSINAAFAFDGYFAGSTYSGQQAMQVQQVKVGTVLDLREVVIRQESQNSTSWTGASIGAAVGGGLGSKIGNGKGRAIATVLGGLVGGAVGDAAGRAANTITVQALEFIVKMESGETIAVTQAVDQDAANIRRGDMVRLIQANGWGSQARLARIGG